MDRWLTSVERAILCRKDKTTGLTRKLNPETETWWSKLIDENSLDGDHLRILSRRGRFALDKTETEMWARLVKQRNLTGDDLRQSIKLGRPTRIKRDKRGDSSGGVTTWGGIRIQFQIIRRRIGDDWENWTIAGCQSVREELHAIAVFYGQLQLHERELAKASEMG